MEQETFLHKPLLRLTCLCCDTLLTTEGMSAVLLSAPQTLYSTHSNPQTSPLSSPYPFDTCACSIVDIGCRVCGTCVGYHVVQACKRCLGSPHNGHTWMLRHVQSVETWHGSKVVRWKDRQIALHR
jgi:hypothetical protein